MSSTQPGGGESSSSSEAQTAFDDLKRLIPSLAAELELLRTSLREHSLWLLRYGHGGGPDAAAASTPSDVDAATANAPTTTTNAPPTTSPPGGAAAQTPPQPQPSGPPSSSSPPSAPSSSAPLPAPPATGEPPPAFTEANEPPAYTASDVPPYTGGFSTVSASTREEVRERRDQLTEWLREGEDVLREYSARHAQLAQQLGRPPEDLLGTWHEAHPDNALPGYQQVERDEALMVGGVGEVPPPYLRGRPSSHQGAGAGAGVGAGAGSASSGENGEASSSKAADGGM